VRIFCVIGSIIYAFIIVIAGKFCRTTSVPVVPAVATSESLQRLAVKDGGGQWVGIQECEGMADLVLFNSPATGSTLAIKASDISADRVRRRIEESDAAFNIQRSI
jgi:hypothetical protein